MVYRLFAALLADEDQLGLGARKLQKFLVTEQIIYYAVNRAQRSSGLERNKRRVARPRAGQIYLADSLSYNYLLRVATLIFRHGHVI